MKHPLFAAFLLVLFVSQDEDADLTAVPALPPREQVGNQQSQTFKREEKNFKTEESSLAIAHANAGSDLTSVVGYPVDVNGLLALVVLKHCLVLSVVASIGEVVGWSGQRRRSEA